MFAYWWAVFVYGIIFGVVTNMVIKNKGYKENWFWWGCLFGVFALIVACTKPPKVAVAGVAQPTPVDSSIPQAIGLEKDYDTLYEIPERQYTIGSPVVINEGKLLKEKETGRIFARCNFQIVTDKKIKAAFVSVLEYDVAGDYLGKTDTQYLDLDRMDGILFGSDHQIALSNIVTRKIEIKCTKVIFADDTKWEAEGTWNRLPSRESLYNSLGMNLGAQYVLEVNDQAKYHPLEMDDLWICSCGFANHHSNGKCVNCGAQKTVVFGALNKEKLGRKYSERKAKEEEEAKQKEAANKKKIKILVISAIIVSIILAIGSVVRNNKNEAKGEAFIQRGEHYGKFIYRVWYGDEVLGERLEINGNQYVMSEFDYVFDFKSDINKRSGTYEVKVTQKGGKDVYYVVLEGRQFKYDGNDFIENGKLFERLKK